MGWNEQFEINFYRWLKAWQDEHMNNPRLIIVDFEEPLRSGEKVSIRIVPYPEQSLPGILLVEDIFEENEVKYLKSVGNSRLMKMFKIDNYKDFLCLIVVIAIIKRDWSFKYNANKWLLNASDSREYYLTPRFRITQLIDEWQNILAQYLNYYREGEAGKGLWGCFVILTLHYYKSAEISHTTGMTSYEYIPPKWFDFIPFNGILKSPSTELLDTPDQRETKRQSIEHVEFKKHWPAYGSRIFYTPEELEQAGPGWFDSQAKIEDQLINENLTKQDSKKITPKYLLKKEDETWTIVFEGKQLRPFKHMIGFEYLAVLLQSPQKDYTVFDLDRIIRSINFEGESALISADNGFEENNGRVCIDEKNMNKPKKDFKKSLDKIKDQIEEEREFGNYDEIQELEEKKSKILKEYNSKYDKYGRLREEIADDNIRTKISKAYKRVLKKIEKADTKLANHLVRFIGPSIGRCVRYNPDHPIIWFRQ